MLLQILPENYKTKDQSSLFREDFLEYNHNLHMDDCILVQILLPVYGYPNVIQIGQ